MTLNLGQRLGPYEVIGSLGAGGMGEVYRARDTRLHREVAIKVLLAGFSADPGRLERFEQEARAAAALNHPNILAVYDVGRHDAAPFIVSELLEGEPLRAAIATGPLPTRKAIEYAIQIAQGLAAAHEKGIIHRDLKPENLFVTTDGRVKILDFGLAKLTQIDQSLIGMTAIATTPPMGRAAPQTVPGAVLGTIGYMAPEQLRGLQTDNRADIFALGVVVYELLAGRRPFRGESSVDVISAILKESAPDLPVIERHIPVALARIVERCLEKNPAMRFQSARDLAFALEAITGQTSGVESATLAPVMPVRRRRAAVFLPWGVAAAATIVAAAIGFIHFREQRPQPAAMRFSIPSPGPNLPEMLALSSDGRQLAFTVGEGGVSHLWVRTMDTLEARQLPGITGVTYPFWSPDGKYLAFFAQGQLKKVALSGGPPITLCAAADGRGGSWNSDGLIVFSPGPTNQLMRVSASGGTPTPIAALPVRDSSAGQRFPACLPDGRHFVFHAAIDTNNTGLFVASLDGGAALRLTGDNTNALYVAVDDRSGFLLFRRDDTLLAQPFDSKRLTFTGDMFPIAQNVDQSLNSGFGAFAASPNGTLVYRSRSIQRRQLMWADRTGKRIGALPHEAAFGMYFSLAPDGKKFAVTIGDDRTSTSDVWLYDVATQTSSRFSFRVGLNRYPVWSPDGLRVAYTFQGPLDSTPDIYAKTVDTGTETLLAHGGINATMTDWSLDGKWLLYHQASAKGGSDVWLLPLDGSSAPKPFVDTPAAESNARFAPSSGPPQWIAYQSSDSGESEVLVQGFPPSRARFQISSGGGAFPRWRRDGKELYYVTPDQKLMAVPVTAGSTFSVGAPHVLFSNAGITGYSPTADGQRVLLNVPGEDDSVAPPMTVVVNWTSELRK